MDNENVIFVGDEVWGNKTGDRSEGKASSEDVVYLRTLSDVIDDMGRQLENVKTREDVLAITREAQRRLDVVFANNRASDHYLRAQEPITRMARKALEDLRRESYSKAGAGTRVKHPPYLRRIK